MVKGCVRYIFASLILSTFETRKSVFYLKARFVLEILDQILEFYDFILFS